MISHSHLGISLLFSSSSYSRYLSYIKKQDFLLKPSGSSWRAFPASPHPPKHGLQWCHSNLDILLLFDSSLYTKYLSLIKKQDFLQKPPGSSWRAIPAYPHAPKHSLQLLHTLTLAFYHFFIALYMQNTFQLPKNRISLKTLKEAVDELFQLNKKRFCINFLFFYILLWSKLTWVKQELSRLSKNSNAIWRPKCSLQSLRVITFIFHKVL